MRFFVFLIILCSFCHRSLQQEQQKECVRVLLLKFCLAYRMCKSDPETFFIDFGLTNNKVFLKSDNLKYRHLSPTCLPLVQKTFLDMAHGTKNPDAITQMIEMVSKLKDEYIVFISLIFIITEAKTKKLLTSFLWLFL